MNEQSDLINRVKLDIARLEDVPVEEVSFDKLIKRTFKLYRHYNHNKNHGNYENFISDVGPDSFFNLHFMNRTTFSTTRPGREELSHMINIVVDYQSPITARYVSLFFASALYKMLQVDYKTEFEKAGYYIWSVEERINGRQLTGAYKQLPMTGFIHTPDIDGGVTLDYS